MHQKKLNEACVTVQSKENCSSKASDLYCTVFCEAFLYNICQTTMHRLNHCCDGSDGSQLVG